MTELWKTGMPMKQVRLLLQRMLVNHLFAILCLEWIQQQTLVILNEFCLRRSD
jgi:hypothetical protein